MSHLLLLVALQLPVGPHLPARVESEIHRLNSEAQVALSEGRFEDARTILSHWPGGAIEYEIVRSEDTVPSIVEEAARDAADVFSTATEGKLRFLEGPNPRIRIEIIKSALPGDQPPKWSEGKVLARIPLSYGNPTKEMPRRAIVTAIARAFGVALGHTPTQEHRTVMGVDDRAETSAPVTLSDDELKIIRHLLDARSQLVAAAESGKRIVPAKPLLSLSPTDINLGTVDEGDKPTASVVIRNEGNAPLEIDWEISCRCLMVPTKEPLMPGESRAVPLGIDTKGFQGSFWKEVSLYTNDWENLKNQIVLRVESLPYYRVIPDGITKINLKDEGETVYEFIVYTFIDRGLKILSTNPSMNGLTAEIETFDGEVFDPIFSKSPTRRNGYRVLVRFSSDFPSGTVQCNVLLSTNLAARPTYSILIQASKGLTASPQSVYFGGVPANTESVRSFRVTHPTDAFKILEMKAEGGPFEVFAAEDNSSGFGYRVNVQFKGGAPGPLSGKVVIRTDHPKYKEIVVPISGMAR
ncbi:MAG: DUF1573 domain-containing protein [Fimbriimonadales bacterium]|nr:DUF1573 domain-containing protein [Fimbriimonadales bacterium]